ncbi:GtrA family protein [Halomonas sp. HMF6819]|uniref:GtrA family protein n=1 Tax=Halomonas sp. HMF6819 TaxID=3373085 RepID=UPI0037ADE4DF
MSIWRESAGFAIVGTVGFLVDAGVVTLLAAAGAGPWWARAASFLAAVATTWQLNRRFTFKHRDMRHTQKRSFGHYVAACLVGGGLNLGTYALLVAQMPLFERYLFLAVAAGSVAGMGANFLLARYWIFGGQSAQR